MKKDFRIEIQNKTGGHLHILPLDRTLLPHTQDIFDVQFSKPLRLRLPRLDSAATEIYTTTLQSLFPYSLDFKRHSLRLVWKLKVKDDNGGTVYGETPPQVTCIIASADEEPPKNVEPGEPD